MSLLRRASVFRVFVRRRQWRSNESVSERSRGGYALLVRCSVGWSFKHQCDLGRFLVDSRHHVRPWGLADEEAHLEVEPDRRPPRKNLRTDQGAASGVSFVISLIPPWLLFQHHLLQLIGAGVAGVPSNAGVRRIRPLERDLDWAEASSSKFRRV